MSLNIGLLCATVVLAVNCGSATPGDEGRPAVKTDLTLHAFDQDTGKWRANLGDMEVEIEHSHPDGKADFGGWLLDIGRTVYEKGTDNKDTENNDPSKETTDSNGMQPEISTGTEKFLEYKTVSEATNENVDKDNEIPLDEGWSKKDDREEFSHMASQDLNSQTEPRVELDLYDMEQYYDSDEVILDPDDYEYFKGVGWFRLDNRHLNWADARYACAEVGAHLAVPDTPERVIVFLELFRRHSDIPAGAILRQQVYVGVSDPDHDRQFTTVQGKPFAPEFPIWFHNEPDNAPPGEYCVTFHIEGRTRDVPCFYRLPFFCEKDILRWS